MKPPPAPAEEMLAEPSTPDREPFTLAAVAAEPRPSLSEMAILAGGGSHEPFQFDHLALAAQFLHDPFTRGLADLLVVGSDETGVFVTEHAPVQHDHRNALLMGLGHRRGEWGRLLGGPTRSEPGQCSRYLADEARPDPPCGR